MRFCKKYEEKSLAIFKKFHPTGIFCKKGKKSIRQKYFAKKSMWRKHFAKRVHLTGIFCKSFTLRRGGDAKKIHPTGIFCKKGLSSAVKRWCQNEINFHLAKSSKSFRLLYNFDPLSSLRIDVFQYIENIIVEFDWILKRTERKIHFKQDFVVRHIYAHIYWNISFPFISIWVQFCGFKAWS